MSIIEQAAKRLEELRRSGAVVRSAPAAKRGGSNDEGQPQRDRSTVIGSDSALPLLPDRAGDDEKPTAAAPTSRGPLPKISKPALAGRPHTQMESAYVEIDLDRLSRMGYLVPTQERTQLANEFRHIKRPLLRNVDRSASEASARSSLIMITSAVAGEGKTFCAVNLAMSIAMEVDTSVLLVDADVVRPTVLDRLGLPPSPGLLDLLAGDVDDVSELLLKTSVPKLAILPAGAPRAMSTELLASDAMDRLLLDLASRYRDRVVVLDAPPLLMTAESSVLAARVGQVVVVVDAGRTSAQKVSQAFATVEDCPVVLSLLNKCRNVDKPDGYGYGY